MRVPRDPDRVTIMRNHRITLVLTLSLLLLAEAVFACDITHVKYRDTPVCIDQGFEHHDTSKSSWISGGVVRRGQ